MILSLNGKWKYRVDPVNVGTKESWWESKWLSDHYTSLKEITLPNNWNTIPELEKYEGIVWFFHSFDLKENENYLNDSDIFLRFKAVNYETRLWVNEVYHGVHEGNFLPFKFKIKPESINNKERNYIVVRIENFRKKNRIPAPSRDWFNYGGIYRDIDLLIIEQYRINWVGIISKIQKGGDASINVHIELNVPKQHKKSSETKNHEIKWDLYYLGDLSSKNRKKRTQNDPILIKYGVFTSLYNNRKENFSIQVEEAQIWSPNNPRLYKIELSLTESRHTYITRFGIREIKVHGSKLLFNSRSLSLQGVSLHEELVP
ncbi:MAG: sugar-binding domain-containing protein, partial [Candidatus Hodarchaeota archaeon]